MDLWSPGNLEGTFLKTNLVVNTRLKKQNKKTDLLGIGGSVWVCAYQPYYIDKRTAGGSAEIAASDII